MNEHPILFKGPMIRAILEGRKTMTRRTRGLEKINERPNDWTKAVKLAADDSWSFWYPGNDGKDMTLEEFANKLAYPKGGGIKCPYGQPGDMLWVRETFCSDGIYLGYRADNTENDKNAHWTASIHMPRWASRITLEVLDVRVERLQGITEEDAKAEGARFVDFGKDRGGNQLPGWRCDKLPETWQDSLGSARFAFGSLWDSINSKKYPWSMNPWVWAITFRRLP